jgi:hypothetical protein
LLDFSALLDFPEGLLDFSALLDFPEGLLDFSALPDLPALAGLPDFLPLDPRGELT